MAKHINNYAVVECKENDIHGQKMHIVRYYESLAAAQKQADKMNENSPNFYEVFSSLQVKNNAERFANFN